MNQLILIALSMPLFFSNAALAETSSLCPGEQGYTYINYRHRPNPTKGGFVSNGAFVDDTSQVFIAPTAAVCGDSNVTGQVKIYGSAVVNGGKLSGSADVSGNARIENGAEITDSAKVTGSARISGSVRISGKAFVGDSSVVSNSSNDNFAEVTEDARLTGRAVVSGNALIKGRARVQDDAVISGSTILEGSVVVGGFTNLTTGTRNTGTIREEESQASIQARQNAAAKAQREQAFAQKQERINEAIGEIEKSLDDVSFDGSSRGTVKQIRDCVFEITSIWMPADQVIDVWHLDFKREVKYRFAAGFKTIIEFHPASGYKHGDRYSRYIPESANRYKGITFKYDSSAARFMWGLDVLANTCSP